MAFVCTAVFGLFCLSAPLGDTQIRINRFRGEGGEKNEVSIKGADWEANFFYQDPDLVAPDIIVSVEPDYAKNACKDGQCTRYEAYCHDRPPFKQEVCRFAFQIGEYAPGQNYAMPIDVRAKNISGIDQALQRLAFIKQTNGAQKILLPMSELKLTMNPPCPQSTCPPDRVGITATDEGTISIEGQRFDQPEALQKKLAEIAARKPSAKTYYLPDGDHLADKAMRHADALMRQAGWKGPFLVSTPPSKIAH